MARQIIAANSVQTLEFVEFTNLNGTPFTIKDAPCLKIIIDLKDEGGLVLQKIGTLINHIFYLRATTFPSDMVTSDALEQVRCNAPCPVPFSVQLSNTVELIVCEACNPCCCPQPDYSRYLLLIAFFLALLALLYLMSLLRKFWLNRYRDCACLSCSKTQNPQPKKVATSCILPTPPVPVITVLEQPVPVAVPIVVPSDLPTNKPETPPIIVIPSDLSDNKQETVPSDATPSSLKTEEQPTTVLSDLQEAAQPLILSDFTNLTSDL